jgi:hypothetical protein
MCGFGLSHSFVSELGVMCAFTVSLYAPVYSNVKRKTPHRLCRGAKHFPSQIHFANNRSMRRVSQRIVACKANLIRRRTITSWGAVFHERIYASIRVCAYYMMMQGVAFVCDSMRSYID